MNRYKNKALNLEEMRRRREEEGVQLRKQKREEQVTLRATPFSLSLAPAFTLSFSSVYLIDGNLWATPH